MLEVFKFIFADGLHFVGTAALIAITAGSITSIILACRGIEKMPVLAVSIDRTKK